MKLFKNSLIAFGGLSIIIGAIALFMPLLTKGQGGQAAGPNVLVVNTPAEPVPVTGTVRVSEGPREPFNRVEGFGFQNGDSATGIDLFTVPADKQLVVTYASAAMTLPGGQKVDFRVNVASNSSFVAIHQLVPVLSGPLIGGGIEAFVGSEPVNIYLRAGQVLSCLAVRNSSAGSASGRCSVSGYLVDVP